MESQTQLWKNFSLALGFDPREMTQLVGASGQTHHFSSLAIDEKQKRLLLFSSELDPRMAAMVHSDVSNNIGDYRLLTARPITFDFRELAMLVQGVAGTLEFDIGKAASAMDTWGKSNQLPNVKDMSVTEALAAFKNALGVASEVIMPFLRAATLSGLNPKEQIILLVRQLTALDWPAMARAPQQIDLSPLVKVDAQQWDREYGLCPVPLYELTGDDWEMFQSGADKVGIATRLTAFGISQYFYPPQDQATLAVIDRGMASSEGIAKAIQKLEGIGHIVAPNEFLERSQDVLAVIDELLGRGLVAEGELGLTVTNPGQAIRSIVKYRPREGAISKLINRLSVNIDVSPKDLLK